MTFWEWLKSLFKKKDPVVKPLPQVNPSKPVPVKQSYELDPAYLEAKKHKNKKETDKTFSAYVSQFWAFVGLKSYVKLGIAGASLAWCAVFFYGMNKETNQQAVIVPSALAREIGKSGITVDWKKDGIAQSMGVWKNSSDCNSSTGNHITWADGDCSAEDLMKPGATWAGYGGNQQDQVKTSIYCAKGDCKNSKDKICRVFVTHKRLLRKVTKSVNCTTGASSAESTR